MLKELYISEKDRQTLSLCKRGDEREVFDYRRSVVVKPWGYEYVIYRDKKAEVWVLYLNKGEGTSFHCHPNKETTLYILSGDVLMYGVDGETRVKKDDGFLVDRGVFHRQVALSDDVFLLEADMPPNKEDLVRYQDKYERAGKVYPHKSYVTKQFNKFKYLYIDTAQQYQGIEDLTLGLVRQFNERIRIHSK